MTGEPSEPRRRRTPFEWFLLAVKWFAYLFT